MMRDDFGADGGAIVRRMGVIAYHSSPLIEPGSGDAGGMTVYVRALAQKLAERSLRTDIFTRAASEQTRIVEIFPGVRVVSIPAGPLEALPKDRQPDFIPDFVDGVRAFATGQRIRYDLLHSHYWQSGLAAHSLAQGWRIPWVHSHHSLGRVKNSLLAPGEKPEPPRRLQGEERVIAGADVLVASTDEEWAQLSCLYGAPHDRLKTLRPGVNHEMFSPGDRPAARARLGLDEDEAVMLYVGRIQPLKGLELGIRALEQLVQALDRRIRFLVVGGASGEAGKRELERLKVLVKSLGVDDVVTFIGAQPHSRLPDFYRAADVGVVCSHSESFGLTALEAHACGTPVIATAVGGLAHIIADGASGYLVGSRDPAEFAAHLKTLLSDAVLQERFRTAAVDRASAFSWDAAADEFLDLYECLVEADDPEYCTC
jgi:D-inositol-3-phosphate glycosyltransferase